MLKGEDALLLYQSPNGFDPFLKTILLLMFRGNVWLTPENSLAHSIPAHTPPPSPIVSLSHGLDWSYYIYIYIICPSVFSSLYPDDSFRDEPHENIAPLFSFRILFKAILCPLSRRHI